MIGVAGGTASGKYTVCKTLVDMVGQSEVTEHKYLSCITWIVLPVPGERRGETGCDPEPGLVLQRSHSSWGGQGDERHVQLWPPRRLRQQAHGVRPDRHHQRSANQGARLQFKTNSSFPGEFTTIYPSDVILVEGIIVFYFPRMRDLFHLKLFVDTDADIRLER